MEKELIKPGSSLFEQIKKTDEKGNEFWTARDMAKVLDYLEYRNFKPVVDKAKEACKNSGQNPDYHVVAFNERMSFGKGAKREMDSFKLSRYACYLIVQNADPNKEVVASWQTYFAIQTQLQEILRKHNIQLADAAKGAGVIAPFDYAIFQNHGYMGLYGGLDAKGIHAQKGLKKSEQILDHMGSTELAANLFRATQTEDKLRRDNIQGKETANQTHFEVGQKVRKTIEELGGTMPENLPKEDSIKRLEKEKSKPKELF